MSSKIGLLLSLVFFALFFVLSVDVMCIQYFYSDLDSKSVMIGYELSNLGEIKQEDIDAIEQRYHVIISYVSNFNPSFGDMIEYTLLKEYQPLIVSNDIMELKIERTTICGYY